MAALQIVSLKMDGTAQQFSMNIPLVLQFVEMDSQQEQKVAMMAIESMEMDVTLNVKPKLGTLVQQI